MDSQGNPAGAGSPRRFGMRTEHGIALLLFAATLALFWPACGFDFMGLDDVEYAAQNPMVIDGLRWEGVRQAFTTVREQWWLPLLWISYMADVSMFGPGPHGHHFANVLLHAANAALLFWVLFRLTGSRWRSAFAAALFAWHPTRVEAVAWIAARKDVLSGFFFMLGLWAYARHAEKPSGRRLAWTCGWLLAGLMSKSVLVAVPFLLLVLDFWPLRRARLEWRPAAWAAWKPLLWEKLPLFGLAAAFMAVNVATHHSGWEGTGHVAGTDRLGMIAPNVVAYLRLIACPLHLSILYPERDVVSWPWSLAATAVLALATVALFLRRERQPYLLAGWLWFLLGLAPVVRGVRLGLAQYADRWTYLPLIGVGIALAWLAAEVVRGRARKALPAIAGLVLAACAAKTHAQLPWWRDTLTMFARAAWLTPVHPLVQSTYGQALYQAGRFGEGEAHLRAALELDPDKAEYLSNWGRALLRLGRAEEALAAQDRALARQPEVGRFHGNRGNALLALGRRDEAQAAFAEAVRLQPNLAEAQSRLGDLLFRSNRAAEALPHYEAAAHLRPDMALNWFNLGLAQAQLGRSAEALANVERALRIDPDLPGAQAAAARLRLLAF